MAFLDQFTIDKLKSKLLDDPSRLGKLYKAKKDLYQKRSVDHSEVEDWLKDGWEEYTAPLKTKTKLRKAKSHDVLFEDQLWCQLYGLGYRYLSYDRNFVLPFGKSEEEKKQIDIVAVNDESILLIECKSSEKRKKAPSFKTEFEGLSQRLNGFRKVAVQAFGENRKMKYIFATRNLRFDPESEDIARLEKTRSFHYTDNTFEYVSSLIKSYKDAAGYQVAGLIFKGQQMSAEPIEVPAVAGKMGGKTYYMFSIEPHSLLKMSFVLHRTAANEAEMPTYQRILIPSRVTGIRKYIENGGYFPNSVIINFSTKRPKVHFTPSGKGAGTSAKLGVLRIPRAYAIAYIIDGQHRLYGYAGSSRKETNTIPVIAFSDLEAHEQLQIFMDINENQKAVSASLRLTLEEDLYWDSGLLVERLKALRSSIVRELSTHTSSPLLKQIQIGEDRAPLQFKPFADALLRSGLLPRAQGNNYVDGSTSHCLYNIKNQDHSQEMRKSQRQLVSFLTKCYGLVAEEFPEIFEKERFLVISNRGTHAFIGLIGALNKYETENGKLTSLTNANDRFAIIEKYIRTLMESLNAASEDDVKQILQLQGSQVETKWLMFFMEKINENFPEFSPNELADWRDMQNVELQQRAAVLGEQIERHVKQSVINTLKVLYGNNWDLEIGPIKSKCQEAAEKEIQKNYKEGLGRKDIPWTDMFMILDYKTMIEQHWSNKPEKHEDFSTFADQFSLDIGFGDFNSKSDKTRWMSLLNSYRNVWAHSGSKEKKLTKEEVTHLEKIYELLGCPGQ